jgi:hypothetical protein
MPAMFLGITYFENLQSSDLQEQVYSIGIVNADGPAFSRLLAETIDFTAPDAPAPVPGSDPADLGSVDIWVVFPEGFAAGDRAAVEIYASSTSTDQRYAAEIIPAERPAVYPGHQRYAPGGAGAEHGRAGKPAGHRRGYRTG